MPHVEADRPGRFKARVLGTGIRKSDKSKSVSISFRFLLTEYFNPESNLWVPWSEYRQTIFGQAWIVKKDGKPNDDAVENVCRVFDWSGNLADFNESGRSWPQCSVTLDYEEYNGTEILKVKWINSYDDEGGRAFGNMEESEMNTMDAVLGSQFRAIAGNVARNKPKQEAVPAAAPPASDGGDEIPF